jgi:uncharacterized protein YeaO (DUF488 family)
MSTIRTKRIYEDATTFDGVRILVDRLWPRGISKEKAQLAYWAKDIAPSTELRQQFHQNLCDRSQFKRLYYAELDAKQEALKKLKEYIAREKVVTFLFSSKELEFNNATVLKKYLEND